MSSKLTFIDNLLMTSKNKNVRSSCCFFYNIFLERTGLSNVSRQLLNTDFSIENIIFYVIYSGFSVFFFCLNNRIFTVKRTLWNDVNTIKIWRQCISDCEFNVVFAMYIASRRGDKREGRAADGTIHTPRFM